MDITLWFLEIVCIVQLRPIIKKRGNIRPAINNLDTLSFRRVCTVHRMRRLCFELYSRFNKGENIFGVNGNYRGKIHIFNIGRRI